MYDGNVRIDCIVVGQSICSNYKLFSEILFMKYYNNILTYTCIHKSTVSLHKKTFERTIVSSEIYSNSNL